MKRLALFALLTLLASSCGRFGNEEKAAAPQAERIIVIGQQYNEIIWDLGAEKDIVGVDFSSTYPPAVKKVQTVGYHRALSAEGILSLKPTLIIHDGSVGPPQVMQQIASLKIPTKTFAAKNDSIDGTKALIREIGAYFHKAEKAEEICRKLDADLAKSLEEVKRYTDRPRVAVIHFGRASNIYLVVGSGGKGDGGGAGQMISWAGGQMAIDKKGMERMASPEVVAKANPDVILMSEFGYDRLGGSLDQIKALPGVATSDAAKNNRIYRVVEHDMMYLNPDSGANVARLAKLIHEGK
ncbi:MAG TPA: ABC transporter substrate-binding protein [Thermoanaerobaculia bacterium]|jgi:iron complex transport system substrate-binding protein|nr:ABC transporter substrate-binding protein [Thermoanaerobaculia bacterium]